MLCENLESLGCPEASLESLDAQYTVRFQKARANWESWVERNRRDCEGVEERLPDRMRRLNERAGSMDPEEEKAVTLEMLGRIVAGDMRLEIEEIIAKLKNSYEPKIDAIKVLADTLRDDMPQASKIFRKIGKVSAVRLGGIVQALDEVLVGQSHRHASTDYDKAKNRITEANKFIADLDGIFKKTSIELAEWLRLSTKADEMA
ncbi:hypothetical protein N431DRAFT_447473 [Stipitochalara longipes BDJ]|nr:hypothetical protein N431DRAFT_447473 [Stipitochalara longipes BDJ]